MNDPLESALQAAFDTGEPDMPECHLCGDVRGPWAPEPTGARWPSGAQKLLCAGGCTAAADRAAMPDLTTAAGVLAAMTDGPAGRAALPQGEDRPDAGRRTGASPGHGRRRAPLSVRMDDRLAADLAAMARAGLNASDAVRAAVSIVADAYRYVWANGVIPEGVQPVITACAVLPHDSGRAGGPGA